MDFINLEKHLVKCPHCGRDVLDHMTECPFCHGALMPGGRRPLDPDKLRRARRALNAVGFAIAAAVVAWVLVTR